MKLRRLLLAVALALLVIVGLVFRAARVPARAVLARDAMPVAPASALPAPPSGPRPPAPSSRDASSVITPHVPMAVRLPRRRVSDVENQSAMIVPVALNPPRVAANEPILPGFVGSQDWKNRGTSSASAAFETHCWAIYNGDVDALLSTVNPSPAARQKLQAVFDHLPAADQSKYGSPERMLAMLWVYHGLPFPAFMIEAEVQRSPTGVSVLLQLQYGQRGADRDFSFTREADGWRKVTPDQQVYNFLRMSGIAVP